MFGSNFTLSFGGGGGDGSRGGGGGGGEGSRGGGAGLMSKVRTEIQMNHMYKMTILYRSVLKTRAQKKL